MVRFEKPPPSSTPISLDQGGSADCPIHILNLYAGINNSGRTLAHLKFTFAKIVAHFELDESLATLLKAASSIPVFSDVNNIFSTRHYRGSIAF